MIYFAVWILTAFLLNKWSLEQDRTADRRFGRRMRMMSAPGLLLFFLTVTFASVDWAMSLNPKWFSTIYGLLFAIAWALSALAFAIAVMSFLTNREPMSRIVRPNHFQDLGKLMLAFVMLWAYFAFSQFLNCLVRQSAGRDPMVSAQSTRRMGSHCCQRSVLPFRFSVFVVVVGIVET